MLPTTRRPRRRPQAAGLRPAQEAVITAVAAILPVREVEDTAAADAAAAAVKPAAGSGLNVPFVSQEDLLYLFLHFVVVFSAKQ